MVGEAGVSPEYFHRSLTFHEANLIIKGLHRRYHAQWDTARWQTTFIAKCAGNKNYNPPKFPWDSGCGGGYHSEDELTAGELQRIIAAKNGFMEDLNKKAQS